MQVTIKTLFGFEDILADEIRVLGGENIEKITRGVKCDGNLEFIYKANLHLRTAMKVLVPIHQFKANSEQELYDNIYEMDWSSYMDHNRTFLVDSVIFSKIFTHSHYVALKTKDAIVDYFRDNFRRRPSVDTTNPDVKINLHCADNLFTLSLDSSGAPLNQRGYREDGHKAPMNESLAAGMLMLSGWDKSQPLVDPMCGSGTILTEAAMMAMNVPPNLSRNYFGFKNWSTFNPMLWNKVKSEAEANIRKPQLEMTGIDIDPKAVSLARRSLAKIGLRREIKIKEMDFRDFKPIHESGMIITNPPYGERIGRDNVFEFYQSMGDALKQNFNGYEAWLISSNTKALKKIGLRYEQKKTLYNGKLECDFCQYKMY